MAERRAPTGGLALLAAAFVVALTAATWLATRGQGHLDPAFGDDGIVTTDIVASGYEQATDVGAAVIEPDGDIVVAGVVGFDLAIARHTTGGRADASFGGDGLVRTDVGGVGLVRGLAVQPDGRILAVGDVRALAPGGATRVVLARYLADGDLDESFGQGGLATAPGWSGPAAVAVQEDGRIVVAGTGLARFTAHGWPDESFGGGGLVEIPAGGLAAVALQPDGKIIVAGDVLARYEPGGTLDETFGNGGVADTAGLGRIDAIAVQPDGRIVVAGALLARYTRDGRLDRSFGGGTVAVPTAESLHAVAIQPDGRIVVGGTAAGDSARFALGRYRPDGTADPGFGDGGFIATDVGGRDAGVRALAVQRDGKIVAIGYRWSYGCGLLGCGGAGTTHLLIVRYDVR